LRMEILVRSENSMVCDRTSCPFDDRSWLAAAPCPPEGGRRGWLSDQTGILEVSELTEGLVVIRYRPCALSILVKAVSSGFGVILKFTRCLYLLMLAGSSTSFIRALILVLEASCKSNACRG